VSVPGRQGAHVRHGSRDPSETDGVPVEEILGMATTC
jgi:hypothetical protein